VLPSITLVVPTGIFADINGAVGELFDVADSLHAANVITPTNIMIER